MGWAGWAGFPNNLIEKRQPRYLEEENSPVEKLVMKHLKPKFGSGKTLEDTPHCYSWYKLGFEKVWAGFSWVWKKIKVGFS